MPKRTLTRSRFITEATTFREWGHYCHWLLRNRDTGLLTEIGQAHLRWLDSFIALMKANGIGDPLLANLMNGLNSPDPDQKARFEAFADAAADHTVASAKPLLAVLEHGKRRAGGKTPEINDAEALRRMRVAVGGGKTVRQAALDVADDARRGGTRESTAKRLERKYWLGER